jgi:hypothetical protein
MSPHHVRAYLEIEASTHPRKRRIEPDEAQALGQARGRTVNPGPAAADDRHAPGAPDAPPQYEIRLKGHLDSRWGARFEGLSFTHDSDGTTVLSGPVVDQAALHGLLSTVRDLGLPLVSVTRVDPKQANRPDVVPVRQTPR